MSISMCDLSFDGQDGCTVNDTVFAYNHVARKGGAVNIATGPWPSRVKFHRCTVANNTAGENIEDDPQGEGGVLNVAPGNWLLLADSLFEDNNAGNKVSWMRPKYEHGKAAVPVGLCAVEMNCSTTPLVLQTMLSMLTVHIFVTCIPKISLRAKYMRNSTR